jgi:hypothetical protein
MVGRSISFLTFAVRKANRLIRSGNIDLLVAMVIYRLEWRLRGLDFGTVDHRQLGLDPTRASFHKDGGGPQLRRLLSRLEISGTDTALDLGSGKGGAMATLARYPFQRVDGVEISSALVEVARSNLTKLGLWQCRVFRGDAGTFRDLDDYTVIFLFHPFSEAVFAQVLSNLDASLHQTPRLLRLIYINPDPVEELILRRGFKKQIDYRPYEDFRICVYAVSAGRKHCAPAHDYAHVVPTAARS